MNFKERYDMGVGYVEHLLGKIKKIEDEIDLAAQRNLKGRQTLAGTTQAHIANGMKATDTRIKDLRDEIAREVARTTMYGFGAMMERMDRNHIEDLKSR